MTVSKKYYDKQKKMWNGWTRRKQLAHVRLYPRTVFVKRYGLKKK